MEKNSWLSSTLDLYKDLYDEAFKGSSLYKDMFSKTSCQYPKCRARKEKNTLVFEFFLPGIEGKDVSVEYDPKKKSLKISREKTASEKIDQYILNEYSSDYSFSREIGLSNYTVDMNSNVDASFKNGVLKISLPLQEPAEEKKIKINFL